MAEMPNTPKETPQEENVKMTGVEEKRTYMSISFHDIPLGVAEQIKDAVLAVTPPGTTVAIYFDNAIVVDQI